MTYFGIIRPPVSGHLYPLSALGRVIQDLGHRVMYFQTPYVEEKIRAVNRVWPIGEKDFPLGTLPRWLAQLGRLQGLVRCTSRSWPWNKPSWVCRERWARNSRSASTSSAIAQAAAHTGALSHSRRRVGSTVSAPSGVAGSRPLDHYSRWPPYPTRFAHAWCVDCRPAHHLMNNRRLCCASNGPEQADSYRSRKSRPRSERGCDRRIERS